MGRCEGRVDIETEWNLKTARTRIIVLRQCVDIETEWNLKQDKINELLRSGKGRYRNRVEFKGRTRTVNASIMHVDIETEWNLKLDLFVKRIILDAVDIETEWNLKKQPLFRWLTRTL